MSHDRVMSLQTETPFLPNPIAGDIMADLMQSFVTPAEGDAQHTRITTYRNQVAAAIDTIELAIAQNHADYLGGRHSWSYETRIEVDTRLKILKRQRQHLSEALGQCNRRLKRLAHEAHQASHTLQATPDVTRAIAFVQMAQQVLDPATLALIWEVVEHQHALTNGSTTH